ncbi:MAG: ATP-binding protein [Gammaproteobacteria bacterium]
MHFAHWRVAIGSAIALVLVVGWIFFFLTGDRVVWIWTAALATAYLLQALTCWRYEKHLPQAGSIGPRSWERVWIGLTFLGGLISGSLMWFMPAHHLALQLSAAMIAGAIAIGEVSASGHRSLIYAAVTSQASMVCLALLFHAHLPWGVPACALFSLVVLHFGLQLNRSMLGSIEQRLHAGQLAREIETSQGRLLEAQHQQSVLQERQRVMQDMHDGLGSALSSSLVCLERGELSVAGAAAVMRECVDDLRLIVDSMEPTASDPATLLGMLRHRLQRRIQASGVALRWHMVDLPALSWLEPSLALDLLRLVQEAITNVLNHAQASELELVARHAGHEIELVVRDNGNGFDVSARSTAGRGVRIMHTRAARLGAQLRVQSVPGVGTLIGLRLPIVRQPSRPANQALRGGDGAPDY